MILLYISLLIYVADTSPSLKTTGGVSVTSTRVDPIPPLRGPASKTISTHSKTSAAKSSIPEQPGWPERLALVPVMGWPTFSTKAAATGCSGRRTPIFAVMAVRLSGTRFWALKTRLTLPGQNLSIMRTAAGEISCAMAGSTSRSGINTNSGLACDRFLIS